MWISFFFFIKESNKKKINSSDFDKIFFYFNFFSNIKKNNKFSNLFYKDFSKSFKKIFNFYKGYFVFDKDYFNKDNNSNLDFGNFKKFYIKKDIFNYFKNLGFIDKFRLNNFYTNNYKKNINNLNDYFEYFVMTDSFFTGYNYFFF